MELESAHQHLNTVLELLSSPVIILDSSYKVVKSNSAFTQVFKMAPEETIGRSIYELGGGVWDIPPMRIRLEKAFAEDKGFFDFELQREFPRVGEKTLLDHARLVAEPGKEGKYVFLAVDDVTERTRAERATEASIGDKADVFLGEIHHRVKNNLQIISSLLNLQAGYVKDQDALRMFRESQDRVRSMAMIHEKLYQSKALTRIDFADYTKTLVRDLFASNPEKSRNVSFSVEAEDAWFDIGIAVPCGLIINELVSNALTHAFPADGSKKAAAEPGKVRVSIRASEDDEVTIVVSDTGAGLPKSVDVGRAETLGLRIVRSLTDQLGGELHAKVAEGTEWTLRFRKKHL